MDPNPYAPPAHRSAPSAGPPPVDLAQYRSSDVLGYGATLFFAMILVSREGRLAIEILGSSTQGFALLIHALLYLSIYVFWLLGVSFFFLWLYRVSLNVRCLGRPTRTSLTMAILWFIVPIASAFMPARVVADIARKSTAKTTSRAPLSVYVWWISVVLSVLTLGFCSFAPEPGNITVHVVRDLLEGVPLGVATIALGLLVHEIAERQLGLREEVAAQLAQR